MCGVADSVSVQVFFAFVGLTMCWIVSVRQRIYLLLIYFHWVDYVLERKCQKVEEISLLQLYWVIEVGEFAF